MAQTTKIDISSSTIYRTILILLGFWLIYTVFDIVIMLFAAFIVASVVEPAANYFGRFKVPRALTVIMVYILILLLLSGIVGLMVNPLAHQARQLAVVAPNIINMLSGYFPLMPTLDQAAIVDSIQTGLLNFGDNVANISLSVFAGTRSVIVGFINFLFVFVIALYLVVEKNALKKLARLVTPSKHYAYVARAIERAQKGIGRWVLGQIVLGTIVGVMVGISLWLIGVPYALLLGILAGVMEILPAIGPVIAATPGVLVAFSQTWVIGLAALIMYIVVGQVESHVLIPNIMRRAVGLKPIVTIVAVIAGAKLLGILGVILAVPVATVVNVFISDLFTSVEGDELAG